MKKYLSRVAVLVVLGTSSHAADDQDAVLWKKMDPWEIRVDQSLDYGCFLFIQGTRGTAIRLGFNKKYGGQSYIMLGHTSWRSIETGKQYRMTIQFDNETPWQGDGTGMWMGDNSPAILLTIDAKLGVEFAQRQTMYVWYGQTPITKFSLRGSYAALLETINCQKTIDANRSPSKPPPPKSPDPFGSNSRPTSDPFKM